MDALLAGRVRVGDRRAVQQGRAADVHGDPGASLDTCGAAASGNVLVTNQQVAARMHMARGECGNQSRFRHTNLLQNRNYSLLQMPLAQEQRRRREIELRPGACDRQQRIDILVARLRHFDHFAVHGLLARQLDLAEQPPDRGMEPEDGAHHLFGDGEEPVAPLDVEQSRGTGSRPARRARVREIARAAAPPDARRRRSPGWRSRREMPELGASTLQRQRHGERPRTAAIRAEPPEPDAPASPAGRRRRSEALPSAISVPRERGAAPARASGANTMTCVVTRHSRGNHLLAPRAHQREQQARRQQDVPVRQPARAAIAAAAAAGDERRHAHQQPDLQAVGDQVAPDQAMLMASSAGGRSPPGLRARGRALPPGGRAAARREPLKTRLTNSRTMAPITWRLGCAGGRRRRVPPASSCRYFFCSRIFIMVMTVV